MSALSTVVKPTPWGRPLERFVIPENCMANLLDSAD
jgi:hypothetical protein